MTGLSFLKESSNEETQWISLSDLMTSLMIVFMLLAISFMAKVEQDNQKIKNIAIAYDKNRMMLYKDLEKEFSKDLKKWDATLDKNLTLRFNEPEVLFATGDDVIKEKFKSILKDFFPRYINVITKKDYKSNIKEIRIEGHTSTVWNNNTSDKEAYFYNMNLSQARTRSTLQYVMELPSLSKKLSWLKQYVTANGLSSSRPILFENGKENHKASQRVEFRVITDSEEKLSQILELQK